MGAELREKSERQRLDLKDQRAYCQTGDDNMATVYAAELSRKNRRVYRGKRYI